MLDVLVTCFAHAPEPVMFPQVRGYYLAKHLARAGVRSQFRQLPVPDVACRVLICAEYQMEWDDFERRLAGPLDDVRSDLSFCLADETLAGRPDHFSRRYCQWFAARGGVLCHLPTQPMEPFERWIGLGVDTETVRPAAGMPRDNVLFDFPRSSLDDPRSNFDTGWLAAIRGRAGGVRIRGSGPPDTPAKRAFDEWVDYGQPHPRYVASALAGTFAFVPGSRESLGLSVAEAQVAGCCIVHTPGEVNAWMLCPEASVFYSAGDPDGLADALAQARVRDPRLIRAQAVAKFDLQAVARRTRAAVGLG